jgi:hypothetical protein
LGSGFLFAEFVTLSEPLLEVLKIKDFLKQFVEADMVLPRSSKNEDLAEDRRGFHYPPRQEGGRFGNRPVPPGDHAAPMQDCFLLPAPESSHPSLQSTGR